MPSHEMRGTDFISVLVADSTRIHTQLMADAMHGDPGLQVVASASNSQDLLAAVARVPIDVAVVSYGLDDQPGHGLEVLREIRALRPEIKSVILLESSRAQDVLDCFRAGAKGIFSKHDRMESLCRCIRCVHEGQIWARSVELDLALQVLASSPVVRTSSDNSLELLSAREREVVQHLAAGMTNVEIADALGLSRHTVKNYLFRIFDKVGVSSRTELLYLTMNSQQQAHASHGHDSESFPAFQRAAEAGAPLAQLRMAEHYHNGGGDGGTSDPVSAYMWVLICQATLATLQQRMEMGEKEMRDALSATQLAEAERRAAQRLAAKKEEAAPAIDKETEKTRRGRRSRGRSARSAPLI